MMKPKPGVDGQVVGGIWGIDVLNLYKNSVQPSHLPIFATFGSDIC
jgi:hypothetical protein